MATNQDTIAEPTKLDPEKSFYKVLRIWPLLILLPAMVLLRKLPALIENGPSMIWMSAAFGPALIAMLIFGWWLSFSRSNWSERIVGFVAMIGGLIATVALMHPSMRDVGVIVMAFPMGAAAFGVMLVLLRKMRPRVRTGLAIVVGTLVLLSTTLLKTDGVWGNFAMGLDWRWSPTGEDRLKEYAAANGGADRSIDLPNEQMAESLSLVSWPGFRGPNSDGVQRGTVIDRDWAANPPKEIWRVPTGAAWSSFVSAGDLLFTQEQRGDEETIVCYRASDGSQVWTSAIPSRFFEPLGGLGPRATPALDAESIYAMGAEGFLIAVNAIDGKLKWKVDLRDEASRVVPMWGFSASPFVYQDLVLIYAGGAGDKGVIAFDSKTGEVRWTGPCGKDSYASVQKVVINDRDLLAILSNEGLHLYNPEDGKVELDYQWPHEGYRALQPQVVDGDKILIPTGMGSGTQLVSINQVDGSLVAEEVWTSRKLKSDFNDCVISGDYIYGFDDMIFICISLKDGTAKWKKGRYGKGQVLLLADSNALIVQGEKGEIVLLDANPEQHTELGRLDGVEGKSWNHPIVVGNRLFARSADEAVCYELAVMQTRDANE